MGRGDSCREDVNLDLAVVRLAPSTFDDADQARTKALALIERARLKMDAGEQTDAAVAQIVASPDARALLIEKQMEELWQARCRPFVQPTLVDQARIISGSCRAGSPLVVREMGDTSPRWHLRLHAEATETFCGKEIAENDWLLEGFAGPRIFGVANLAPMELCDVCQLNAATARTSALPQLASLVDEIEREIGQDEIVPLVQKAAARLREIAVEQGSNDGSLLFALSVPAAKKIAVSVTARREAEMLSLLPLPADRFERIFDATGFPDVPRQALTALRDVIADRWAESLSELSWFANADEEVLMLSGWIKHSLAHDPPVPGRIHLAACLAAYLWPQAAGCFADDHKDSKGAWAELVGTIRAQLHINALASTG